MVGGKTVREVVELLLKEDQNAMVELRIGSPWDTACSPCEIGVSQNGNKSRVLITAEVYSDDPDTFMPGA